EEAALDPGLGVGDLNPRRRAVALLPRAAEEGGILPELGLLPRRAGAVVVALGALEFDAQEQPGGAAGDVRRVVVVGAVERLAVGAGEQLADQPVVGRVLPEVAGQPRLQLRRDRTGVRAGPRQQELAPVGGEVRGAGAGVVGAVE